MSKSENAILAAIADCGPCSMWDLASTYSGKKKDGPTGFSYSLIHRLVPRLVNAGLIVVVASQIMAVAKQRGRPPGPAKVAAWRNPLPQRKHSPRLYGLTFRGYVEHNASSKVDGCLRTTRNYRKYLSYPILDNLAVFERLVEPADLELLLWNASFSALNVTRKYASDIEHMKRLRRKPEYRSLVDDSQQYLETSPTERDFDWVPHKGDRGPGIIREERKEPSAETAAKKQFAVAFFIGLEKRLRGQPTQDLRKKLHGAEGISTLNEFLSDAFEEQVAEYARVRSAMDWLAAIFPSLKTKLTIFGRRQTNLPPILEN